ncbi:MAG: DUF2892 domain-containing protein [Smithellaceae bacterium]|nr:DUF2892 domain-containing protein [Smithellaceae bacterium]
MKCNVGKVDRVIRGLIALAIIGVGIYYQSWWGALGLILLPAVFTGYCPAYAPFGISTCKGK